MHYIKYSVWLVTCIKSNINLRQWKTTIFVFGLSCNCNKICYSEQQNDHVQRFTLHIHNSHQTTHEYYFVFIYVALLWAIEPTVALQYFIVNIKLKRLCRCFHSFDAHSWYYYNFFFSFPIIVCGDLFVVVWTIWSETSNCIATMRLYESFQHMELKCVQIELRHLLHMYDDHFSLDSARIRILPP